MDATTEVDHLVQHLVDDLPVGVWAARAPSGELLYANKMFGELMGMAARDDVVAGEYAQPYGIFDRGGAHYPEHRMPFVRALAERVTVTCDDIVIHRPDGSNINVRAQARPVVDATGTITHVVIAFIDISREVLAERARDAFLSVAAHELRTPIATLQLRMHYLKKRLADGTQLAAESMSSWLAACDRQARRLARLSDQLLDVSRIERGRFDLDLEEANLLTLVSGALETVRELTSNAPPEIQLEGPSELRGRFDRHRLEHVITNLVSNAVKYGKGRPVVVRLSEVGGRAQIAVSDQGIGIAEEHQDRIFEPFERAVSPRSYGGLGLGLWIARQNVESMGGRIQVTSEPERGATFLVDLPLDP